MVDLLFWFGEWSSLESLMELLGTRGTIDIRIPYDATLASVLNAHRRRRHRNENF